MRTIELTTWAEVRACIGETRPGSELIWRGQGDTRWSLSSSLFRFFEGHQVPSAARVDLERRAIQAFSSLMAGTEGTEGAGWPGLLLDMQHHGCPTRLVDWTWSPYVACYFAVMEVAGQAAIYRLDLTEYQAWLAPMLPFDDYDHGLLRSLPERLFRRLLDSGIQCPILFDPKRTAGRCGEQQSVFLMDMDLARSTEEALKNAPAVLDRIVFPTSVRVEALVDLARMNIDGFHLFAGMEGAARRARDHLLGVESPGRCTRLISLPE